MYELKLKIWAHINISVYGLGLGNDFLDITPTKEKQIRITFD